MANNSDMYNELMPSDIKLTATDKPQQDGCSC
jgi:hypothetical protein